MNSKLQVFRRPLVDYVAGPLARLQRPSQRRRPRHQISTDLSSIRRLLSLIRVRDRAHAVIQEQQNHHTRHPPAPVGGDDDLGGERRRAAARHLW